MFHLVTESSFVVPNDVTWCKDGKQLHGSPSITLRITPLPPRRTGPLEDDGHDVFDLSLSAEERCPDGKIEDLGKGTEVKRRKERDGGRVSDSEEPSRRDE